MAGDGKPVFLSNHWIPIGLVKKTQFYPSRRTISAIKIVLRMLLIVFVVEFAILIGLVGFSSLNLLDWPLIVSLVVVEVPIGVFLWYILGERRHSKIQEVTDRIETAKKFKHLRIHNFSGFHGLGLNWYYIENLSTKRAYDCPPDMSLLGKWGVINMVKHKNEEETNEYFRNSGVIYEERDPTDGELSLV